MGPQSFMALSLLQKGYLHAFEAINQLYVPQFKKKLEHSKYSDTLKAWQHRIDFLNNGNFRPKGHCWVYFCKKKIHV